MNWSEIESIKAESNKKKGLMGYFCHLANMVRLLI